VRLGQAFMPMHWGTQFMRGAGVNALMSPAFDPYSKQPELKAAAIEVKPAKLPHRVVAMRRFADAAGAAQHAEALKPLVQSLDYATLTYAGREEVLVTLRGYAAAPIADSVLDALDQAHDLIEPAKVMRYIDARRRVEKAARIDDGIMTSVCLSGETAAADWLKGMMLEGASMEAVRPWILAPVSSPPQGSMARGTIVCNCLNVSENEIREDARAGLDFAACQAKRKCGTSCGSCVPEVKRIILSTAAAGTSPLSGGQSGEGAGDPARVLPRAA